MSGRRSTKSSRRPSAAVYGKLNIRTQRKLAGLFAAIVLAFVLLAVRVTMISAQHGQQYARQVLSQTQAQYQSTSIPFKRGDILDANGTVLATSRKVYNVILDCFAVNSNEAYYEPTIEAATEQLGADEGMMRRLLTEEETKNSRYRIIAKEVSIEDKQAFEAYLADTSVSEAEQERRDLVNGIWFEEEYVRTYPFSELACDVVGFTNSGDTADWGLEGYYNNTLNGANGRKYGYYNEDADLTQTIIEPDDGDSIVSTIDVNIQQITEKYIAQYMEDMKNGPFGDRGAANVGVIVMSPRDGSIQAMASTDPYDLNNPRDLTPYYSDAQISAMTDEQMLDALNGIWRNYCISDTYEPGSTYKPVTVATALESGTMSGTETFFCDGGQTVAGTTIKCHKTEGHGEEAISEVLRNSCNDALMQIAGAVGVDEFCKYQDVFGFGSRTGIDLSGEASGILHTTSTMGEVDLATSAFGQGFTCTMIQEAAAVSSLINGGYYYRPRLVSKVLDSAGRTVRTIEPTIMKQTVSSQVSDMIRTYLKKAVDPETSIYAKIDGYSCGGKTGTAQKVPRGNGKYLVSYIGFWPAENPQILCYVVVDEPNVNNQANNGFAQIICREIMTEVLPYKGIFPDEQPTGLAMVDIPGLLKISGETEGASEDAQFTTDAVPDTNVPEPEGTQEVITGGDYEEAEGYTNEEAGI